MSGPRLTQRKIDKLRDAINVVAETDHVQKAGPGSYYYHFVRARQICDNLQRLLELEAKQSQH